VNADDLHELDSLRDDLLVVLHQASEVRDALDRADGPRTEDTFEVLHLAITATAARVRSVARPELDSSDPAAVVAHAQQSWGQATYVGSVPPGTLSVSLPASLFRQILEDLHRQARARRFPLVLTIDARGGAQAEVVVTASEAPSCTRLVTPDTAELDWLCLATDLVESHGGNLSRFVDPDSGARRTTVGLPTVVTPRVVVAG
jgi:hypothetical protein